MHSPIGVLSSWLWNVELGKSYPSLSFNLLGKKKEIWLNVTFGSLCFALVY